MIAERGYRSFEIAVELMRLGCKQAHASTPALLIRMHDVRGQLSGYTLRPDEPREVGGRIAKYERPNGSRQFLNVPLRCRDSLGDPSVTLYVTEGAKKVAALASQGLWAVSLSGVWASRRTNDSGGTTALPA